jgi:hypothetical protein
VIETIPTILTLPRPGTLGNLIPVLFGKSLNFGERLTDILAADGCSRFRWLL